MLIGVLEDDLETANLYSIHLTIEGHESHVFSNSIDFVRDVMTHPYDAIICDYTISDSSNGAEVIEEIRASKPDLPALLVSAMTTAELGQVEQRLGNVPTMQKPISMQKVIDVAEQLARRERIAKLKPFVLSA